MYTDYTKKQLHEMLLELNTAMEWTGISVEFCNLARAADDIIDCCFINAE